MGPAVRKPPCLPASRDEDGTAQADAPYGRSEGKDSRLAPRPIYTPGVPSPMDESASSPSDSIQHDAAVAIAHAVLNVIASCLRPEERPDALHEFYHVIRAGLEAYEETIAQESPDGFRAEHELSNAASSQ